MHAAGETPSMLQTKKKHTHRNANATTNDNQEIRMRSHMSHDGHCAQDNPTVPMKNCSDKPTININYVHSETEISRRFRDRTPLLAHPPRVRGDVTRARKPDT